MHLIMKTQLNVLLLYTQDMSRQLVIISAQLLDFGDYSCLAKNDAGEDRLHFVVSIMG